MAVCIQINICINNKNKKAWSSFLGKEASSRITFALEGERVAIDRNGDKGRLFIIYTSVLFEFCTK